jgi:argininosuccinate lyase
VRCEYYQKLQTLTSPPPRRPIAPQNVPFRETHHISGAAVKMAEDRGCTLSDLSPDDLRTIHPLFEDDVAEVSQLRGGDESRGM